MSYLGFDPLALSALASALRTAADETRAVRLDDVEAHGARRQLALCLDIVDRWSSWTASLVSCSVLDGYEPVELRADDLALGQAGAWWLARRGLAVVRDPVGDPLDRIDQAVALAQLLRDLPDLSALVDDDLTHLVARLHDWRHDDAAGRAFWGTLGEAGTVALVQHLSGLVERVDQRAASDAHRATEVGLEPAWPAPSALHEQLDTVLASLAHHLQPQPSRALGLLDALDVDAAARLFEHVTLDAALLAGAGRSLLSRWGDRDWTHEGSLTRRNLADRVVDRVALDPDAARRMVTEDGSVIELDLLLFGPNDADAPRRLWLAATSGGEPGSLVRQLLDRLRDHPLTANPALVGLAAGHGVRPPHAMDPDERWREIRGWVGDVVAPWQMFLTGFADEWGWDWPAGVGALAWVAAEPRAAAALAAGVADSLAAIVPRLSPGMLQRWEDLNALGWSVGAIDTVLMSAAHDEHARQQWIWNMVGMAVHRGAGTATGLATGALPPPLPQMLGAVVHRAVGKALDHIGGDEREVARWIARSGIDRQQAAALATVTLLFDQLVDEGQIAPDTPPPPVLAPIDPADPRALGALDEWLLTAPLPEQARLQLQHAAGVMTGASDRGAFSAGS